MTATAASARTYYPGVVVSVDPDGTVSGADFSDAIKSMSDFPSDYPDEVVEADQQAVAAADLDVSPVNADHEIVGAVAVVEVHPDGTVRVTGYDLS